MRQKALEYTRVVLRFAVVALAVSLPLMAQGGDPFIQPLNALQQFALYFARIVSVIAVVFGAMQMAFGDHHRAGGFIGILIGVGAMAYAQQIVTWLFP